MSDSALERPVFTVSDRVFRWEDVILAADVWGDWAECERAAREGLVCVRRALRTGFALSGSEFEDEERVFRRLRKLLAAEELYAWLETRDLEVGDWRDSLRGTVLRRQWAPELESILESNPAPAEVDLARAVWAYATCSGVLDDVAGRLATRAAVGAALGMRKNVARWLDYYKTIGARFISFGAIVLRRRESGTPWVTALNSTTALGDRAADQLTRLLDGQDPNRSLDDRGLMTQAFSLPEGLGITQRFQRRDATFVARPAMVKLKDGLGVSAAIDPDALDVLFACEGRRTLSEIVQAMAHRRDQGPEPLARIAVDAARELLGHGLLAV